MGKKRITTLLWMLYWSYMFYLGISSLYSFPKKHIGLDSAYSSLYLTHHRTEGVKMANLYIPLLLVFAAFGAFCFNMGHRRAYRIVLKGLLKGQILLISDRSAYLKESKNTSQEELVRARFSYEAIGQQVIGWYKYFRVVREDKELAALKGQIKGSLREYLSTIETTSIEKSPPL